MMKRGLASRLYRLVAMLITICLLGWAPVANAFHFPWDQGHDTFDPEEPDDDTDPEDDDCNNTGSPVELSTGNFIYKHDEFFVPALGPDFDLTLTYNSRDMRDGPFGFGWSFELDQRIIEVSDGMMLSAICRQGDGKRERFVERPDGGFDSPDDVFSTLERDGDEFVVTDRDGRVRRFAAGGELLSAGDRNGNALTVEYDANGAIDRITDAAGRVFDFSLGPDGRVASVSSPGARTWTYRYDADGNLVGIGDPLGNEMTYVYDAKHNLTSVIDARGNPFQSVTYDGENRVSTFTEIGAAEVWTLAYSGSTRTKRDTQGNTWTYSLNENGNIAQIVDPLGGLMTYDYNEDFLVSRITDKKGNVLQYEHDGRGQMTAMVDPLGQRTEFTFGPVLGQVTSVTDPLGRTTQFIYDASGNLVTISDALGGTETIGYDASGTITSHVDRSGGSTTMVVDSNGNALTSTDPLGRVTTATYNLVGEVTSITDGEGNTSALAYDAKGRLLSETDPMGGVTSYAYDAMDNLLSISTPGSSATVYTYDAFNRVASVTEPDGGVFTLTYDRRGNLATITDPLGVTKTHTYNVLDMITQDAGPTNTTTYTYDPTGNITRVSDSDTVVDYQYDALNRIVQTTHWVSGEQIGTVASTYDAVNARTQMASGSRVVNYSHDSLNRLTSIATAGDTYLLSYAANSERSSLQMPNGAAVALSYDVASGLSQITHTIGGAPVLQVGYQENGAGNRVVVSELSGATSLSYDARGQLTATATTVPGRVNESYGYDASGNRTSSHLSSAYSYGPANRIQQNDQFSYTFDGVGNIASKTELASGDVTTYSFDQDDQLVGMQLPDGTAISYRYDGVGRRVEKSIDGVVTRYLYDREDIIRVLDGSGATTAEFLHGTGIDEPLSMSEGADTFYFHRDGLGSVRALSDGSGTVVETYDYDSFGRIVASSGSSANFYAYTSRELDRESGLYYYRARYYDPELGRFLSEDPLAYEAGLNFYTYVHNNPATLVDPSGQFVQFIVGGAGSVLSGYLIAKLTGDCYTWKDALLDAGTGAAGVGLVNKLRKLRRIRELRNLAKKNGLKFQGRKGYVEKWSDGAEGGQQLNIKFEAGKSPGLMAGSKQPRFSYRTGAGTYWDPFTGAVQKGRKSPVAHTPLGNPISPGGAGGVGGGTGAAGGGIRSALREDCECK